MSVLYKRQSRIQLSFNKLGKAEQNVIRTNLSWYYFPKANSKLLCWKIFALFQDKFLGHPLKTVKSGPKWMESLYIEMKCFFLDERVISDGFSLESLPILSWDNIGFLSFSILTFKILGRRCWKKSNYRIVLCKHVRGKIFSWTKTVVRFIRSHRILKWTFNYISSC